MNQGRIPVDQEPFRRDEKTDATTGDEGVGESAPPNVTEVEPPSPSITDTPDRADGGRGSEGGAAGSNGAAGDVGHADTAQLQRDLASQSDKLLRLAAEFDNYKRRIERERAESYVRAQGDLAKHLLDAIDDLERVAHHAAGEVNYQALLEGVQLIEKKLRASLSSAGLEIIDATGANFDPNSMEAVAMLPSESEEDDDVVSDVFQRGYRFKGTLLRPARVRVKKYQG